MNKINDILKIRNYFGEHDKTPFEHWAYNFLDKLAQESNLVEAPVSDDFGGLYWKHRCEAAELFIKKSPCDPDITKEQIEAYAHWKKLCDIKPEDYNKC